MANKAAKLLEREVPKGAMGKKHHPRKSPANTKGRRPRKRSGR